MARKIAEQPEIGEYETKAPPLSPEKQARMDLIADLLASPAVRTQLRADLFAAAIDPSKAIALQGSSPAISRFDFQNGCRSGAKLLDSFETMVGLSKQSKFEFAFVPYVTAAELAERQVHLARLVNDLGLPGEKLFDLTEHAVRASDPAQPPVTVVTLVSLTRSILAERDRSPTPAPEPVISSNSLEGRLSESPVMKMMPELLEVCTAQQVLTGLDLMHRIAVIKNPITNVAIGVPNARKQTKDFLAGDILLAPPKSTVSLTTVRIAEEFGVPIRTMLVRFDFPESLFERLPMVTDHASKPLRASNILHYLMPEVEEGLAASRNIMTTRQTESALVELGEHSGKTSRQLSAILVEGRVFLPGQASMPSRPAQRLFEAAGVSPDIACRRLVGKTPEQIVAEANRLASEDININALVVASGARGSGLSVPAPAEQL